MDLLMEIIFELFLEGSMEATMNSKVPKSVRFILLGLLIMIYSSLLYVAVSIAIEHHSILAWICSAVIAGISVGAFVRKYCEFCRRKEAERQKNNA